MLPIIATIIVLPKLLPFNQHHLAGDAMSDLSEKYLNVVCFFFVFFCQPSSTAPHRNFCAGRGLSTNLAFAVLGHWALVFFSSCFFLYPTPRGIWVTQREMKLCSACRLTGTQTNRHTHLHGRMNATDLNTLMVNAWEWDVRKLENCFNSIAQIGLFASEREAALKRSIWGTWLDVFMTSMFGLCFFVSHTDKTGLHQHQTSVWIKIKALGCTSRHGQPDGACAGSGNLRPISGHA